MSRNSPPQKRLPSPSTQLLLTAAGESGTAEAYPENSFSSLFASFDLDSITPVVGNAREEEAARNIEHKHLSNEEQDLPVFTLTRRVLSILPPRQNLQCLTLKDNSDDNLHDTPLTASVECSKADKLKLVAPSPLDDTIVLPAEISLSPSSGCITPSNEIDQGDFSKRSSHSSSCTSLSASLKSSRMRPDETKYSTCHENPGHDWHGMDDALSLEFMNRTSFEDNRATNDEADDAAGPKSTKFDAESEHAVRRTSTSGSGVDVASAIPVPDIDSDNEECFDALETQMDPLLESL